MHWSYCSLTVGHRYNFPALSHWNAMSRFASGAARGIRGNLPRWLAQVWGVLLSSIPGDHEMVAPSRRKLPKRRGKPCPPGYNHKVRQTHWTRCLVAHAPTMAVSYSSRHAFSPSEYCHHTAAKHDFTRLWYVYHVGNQWEAVFYFHGNIVNIVVIHCVCWQWSYFYNQCLENKWAQRNK